MGSVCAAGLADYISATQADCCVVSGHITECRILTEGGVAREKKGVCEGRSGMKDIRERLVNYVRDGTKYVMGIRRFTGVGWD